MSEPEYLSPDAIGEIINYSIYASAAIFIMRHAAEWAGDVPDSERLEGFNEMISVVYELIPNVLRQSVALEARFMLENAREAQQIMDEFSKEIEEYNDGRS